MTDRKKKFIPTLEQMKKARIGKPEKVLYPEYSFEQMAKFPDKSLEGRCTHEFVTNEGARYMFNKKGDFLEFNPRWTYEQMLKIWSEFGEIGDCGSCWICGFAEKKMERFKIDKT